MLKPSMRTTGNRKNANSRTSAGSAGSQPLEDMDQLGLDADGDPAADRRQRTGGLADDQLHAVVAGEPELDRRAEIDRFPDLAVEAVGAATAEPLRPHQHPDTPADRRIAPRQQAPAGFEI